MGGDCRRLPTAMGTLGVLATTTDVEREEPDERPDP